MITLDTRLLNLTAKELKVKAEAEERKIADHIIKTIKNQGLETKYYDLLKYSTSPSLLLKKVYGDALALGGEASINFNISKQGQFRTYPYYSIDGEAPKKISQARVDDMREIAKKSGERDMSDWKNRLGGIIWEEAGEEIINRGLDKIFGKDRTAIVGKSFTKSDNWKVDSKTTVLVEMEDDNHNIWAEFKDINLDHKTSLDNFHFADGNINLTGRDYNAGYSIPDNLMAKTLRQRMEGYYPIYYSTENKSILLSSEILSNPTKFYLKEPKEFTSAGIEQLARDIYKEKREGMISKDFGEVLKDRLFLEKDIWNTLTKATYKVNMWYGKMY